MVTWPILVTVLTTSIDRKQQHTNIQTSMIVLEFDISNNKLRITIISFLDCSNTGCDQNPLWVKSCFMSATPIFRG